MCSTNDSGEGTNRQLRLENLTASQESLTKKDIPPLYSPTEKHEAHGWGSTNPIKSQTEGQYLLETGIKSGKQIYNVTEDGVIVKFQPDNTPLNGYHAYAVSKPRDISNFVLKKLEESGKLPKAEINKIRKGKGKKK